MILLTGTTGFIGSCLLSHLNNQGLRDIVIVDEFERTDKLKNLIGKQYRYRVHRAQLFDWLPHYGHQIQQVYHLGARTDTTHKNSRIFHTLNLSYSKKIWQFCATKAIPLVYASSAATYGLGEYGFKDEHAIVANLTPLNAYASSKNNFDKWALKQSCQPPAWYGLKFFNVYGPNEYHKGRMASVIFHAFHQIRATKQMKLFKSHHSDFEHGKQSRDFIYVEDVVKLCQFFMQEQPANGLYNVGTGKARTFLDLVKATFKALDLPVNSSFIDTPLDIRATYQYFTEADMGKTITAGYLDSFYTLEDGVEKYVQQYLARGDYF